MVLSKSVSFFRKMNGRERETLLYLFLAQSFNGLCLGILLLQEVILRKTLSGSSLQITLLTMVNPVANVFIVYVMDIFSQVRRRKLIFILLGVFGKLVLILMLFVNSSVSFLLVIVVYSVLNVLISPFLTGIIQKNVSKMRRGVIYGITGSAGTLFSLLASVTAGYLLDFNSSLFRILFAMAGIAGFICCYFYSRITIDEVHMPSKSRTGIEGITKPIQGALSLLKRDKSFAAFEASFFIYGIGFMIVLPAIPIYFVDVLKLDYSQISAAKGLLGQAGIILFLPVMGFFSDRMNPMKFSSLSFFILSFYPLLLFFAGGASNVLLPLYCAFAVYSVAMAGVSVLWDLSTIFFAGDNDSKEYQVVHIFLTGIRGLLVPPLGYFIMKKYSISAVFLTSFLMYIAASASMLKLYFSCRRRRA